MIRRIFRMSGKLILFLYSFFPLFILLFLNNIKIREDDNIYSISNFMRQFYIKGLLSPEGIFWTTLFILLFLSVMSIFCFYNWYVKDSIGRSMRIVGKRFSKADVFGYLMGYIIPLYSINISSYRSLVINGLVFFMIAIFYIKDNKFYLNPILSLLNYNIYEVDEDYIYITKLNSKKLKNLLARNIEIEHTVIADNIFLVKDYNND